MIYLSAPDREDQRRIFDALTRNYILEPGFDPAVVLDECSPNYTGADMYALCSDAMLNSVRRVIEELEESSAAGGGALLKGGRSIDDDVDEIVVTTADFLKAVSELTPSVSNEEIAHYKSLHAQFSQ